MMKFWLQLDALSERTATFRQGGDQPSEYQRAGASIPREVWEKEGQPIEIELTVGAPDFLEANREAIQREIEDPANRITGVKKSFRPFDPATGSTMPTMPKAAPGLRAVRDEPQA